MHDDSDMPDNNGIVMNTGLLGSMPIGKFYVFYNFDDRTNFKYM